MKPEDLPTSTSIRFTSGPMQGQTFSIHKPITTIGRESTNDIVVRNDAKVSRSHARLLWKDGWWSIEKLSQTSFLTVNNQKVQRALISNNTIIGLGEDSSFVFLSVEVPLSGTLVQGAGQSTVPRLLPVKEEAPPPVGMPQAPRFAGTLPSLAKPSSADRAAGVPLASTPSAPAPPDTLNAVGVPLAGTREPAGRPDATQIASFRRWVCHH